MLEINGKSVYNALAMGRLHFLNRDGCTVKRFRVEITRPEILRFESARAQAKKDLHILYEKALTEVGEANAQIFQIHLMMLDDEDYFGAITSAITNQKVNAEYAVSYTSDIFARTFSEMDDEYMQARASDVKDIANRLIAILTGNDSCNSELSEPSIIVADDLTPSETVQMDKEKILGFVTFGGSPTSHTAILARTMNIPAVIGTGSIDCSFHGETAILDGFSGTLYINPDEQKIADYKKRKELEDTRLELLSRLRGQPDETRSGKKIKLYANIGNPSDIGLVIRNDAGGIGLFRSEFLYLESNTFPSEEEQFLKYKEVAENMLGKPVIVRTLDIGADKKIDYFNLPEEENPALGYRAIRICLTDKALFKTQLRALLRASVFGNISIMFPMIISEKEITNALEILEEAKSELRSDGIPFKEDMEIGIMIETPAAAIISDTLAPYVNFFSIGTNDLTQYTLAIDRQNPHLEQFFDPHHPAILRLIETVVQNAHRYGKWVGICGELGADQALTETFINMGVDELSVSPSFVLPLREKIRNIS
ncbi:MAG: phosphoenolpyruvate--protein phosphotransferase [Ruminococcaceae bacterium]|nr:phosphoenolpyruvate--protein phosphotransferase [Oscillospiraceae bacterium]